MIRLPPHAHPLHATRPATYLIDTPPTELHARLLGRQLTATLTREVHPVHTRRGVERLDDVAYGGRPVRQRLRARFTRAAIQRLRLTAHLRHPPIGMW